MLEFPATSMQHLGQVVPIVAFYSVQGGVGKTTLARKFAELVTLGPGREGRKPNVLLVDLDVEAQGLTFRLAQRLRTNFRTVHEIIAERNPGVAQAITVTGEVSLTGGDLERRGQLYLVPAAPPDAKGLFDTISGIDRPELFKLLFNMIHSLVIQYDIGCVVIDCAPGANPYSAAAATLATVPLLIGRNEQTTYDQIRVLPERFREMYPAFQPARQRVIINAVAVKDLYESRAQQYSIFDYIPLTSDVIHETEGLARTGSLRMLLFEKYVVDIVKQVFVGMNHLIPEAPEILGQEWMDALQRLERCEEAPKVRRLGFVRHALSVGAVLVVAGVAILGWRQLSDAGPVWLSTAATAAAIAGVVLIGCGWYADHQRNRILMSARELVFRGPDEVFRRLREGVTHRRALDEMKALAETIPEASREYGVKGAGQGGG